MNIIERIPPVGRMAVYALLHPRTRKVCYVGVTTQHPYMRLAKHQEDVRMGRSGPLHHWLQSLEGQDPLVALLEIIDPDDWKEAESRWIVKYRRNNPDLLNVANGGPGGWRGSWSEEERAEQSRKLKGKPKSAAHRAALSEATKKAWERRRVAQ